MPDTAITSIHRKGENHFYNEREAWFSTFLLGVNTSRFQTLMVTTKNIVSIIPGYQHNFRHSLLPKQQERA